MTEIKIAISKRELERIWWDVAANGALMRAEEAVKAEVFRRLILAGADVNQVGSELTWWDAVESWEGREEEVRVFSWRPAGVRGSGGGVGWWARIWRRVEGWLWSKEMK